MIILYSLMVLYYASLQKKKKNFFFYYYFDNSFDNDSFDYFDNIFWPIKNTETWESVFS